MKKDEKYQKKSADNLLKWIEENRETWQSICLSDAAEIRPEEYLRLLKELQKEKFYSLVILLLTKGAQSRIIEESLYAAGFPFSSSYEACDVGRIIRNLEDRLAEQKQ